MSRAMSRDLRKMLAYEQLEAKQMLAGDVMVSLVGGNLLVRGDDAANHVAISSGPTANSFIIRGLDGTAVKMGDTTAPETGLVVNNVRGLVNVNMNAGDDVVEVSNATFRLGLSIETGAGNDTVLVGTAATTTPPTTALAAAGDANVNARGALNVFTGIGNDTVRMASVGVGGFLNIATLSGDDTVQLGESSTAPALAASSLSSASVRAGLAIGVALGDGVDSAQFNNVAAGGAIVAGGGAGADTIGMNVVRATSLLVSGGVGDAADVVNVTGAKAFLGVIGTGGGADQASIADSTFTALEVALGAGDDRLSLSGVKSKQAFLAGGEGTADELADAGNNTLGRLTVTGFEIPEGVNVGRPARLGDLLANLLARLRR